MLLNAEHRWHCPNCDVTAITRGVDEVKYHHCAGLGALWVPMVPAGEKAKVIAVEREDYIGTGQIVPLDANGRPIMSALIVNDHTQSAVIFAPTAVADLRT